MQRLELSGAVRPIYGSLDVKTVKQRGLVAGYTDVSGQYIGLIPKGQRVPFFWNASTLKTGPICSSETPINTHQPKFMINPHTRMR